VPEESAVSDLVLTREGSVTVGVPADYEGHVHHITVSRALAYGITLNLRVDVGVEVNDRNWSIYFVQALQDGQYLLTPI
jgi:hypothetical protein